MVKEESVVWYITLKDLKTNKLLKYDVHKLMFCKSYENIRKLIKDGYLIVVDKNDNGYINIRQMEG